jgi:hypothetical protein
VSLKAGLGVAFGAEMAFDGTAVGTGDGRVESEGPGDGIPRAAEEDGPGEGERVPVGGEPVGAGEQASTKAANQATRPVRRGIALPLGAFLPVQAPPLVEGDRKPDDRRV